MVVAFPDYFTGGFLKGFAKTGSFFPLIVYFVFSPQKSMCRRQLNFSTFLQRNTIYLLNRRKVKNWKWFGARLKRDKKERN
jgi:hypothetical protein